MYDIGKHLSLASAMNAFRKVRILSVMVPTRKELDVIAGDQFLEKKVPNAFHEALFSASPLATILVEKDGRVLWTNPAFLELFGYQYHDVFQKKIVDLVHKNPEIDELVTTILSEAFTVKKTLTRTATRERNDGTRTDVLLTAIPFKAHGKYYAYGICHNVTEREQTQSELLRSTKELEVTLGTAIQALSRVIEAHDPYTARHQQEVAHVAAMIATEMHLSQEAIKTLHVAALLHNIGKIAVPADLLNKPGELDETERTIINNHPQKGYEIVRTMEFPDPVAECVLQHHERLDGSGYPKGLHGDEILPLAQIIAVADVFGAMTSHRPYRPASGYAAAMEELKTFRDIKYNSHVVDALDKLVLSDRLTDIIKADG